MFVCQQPPTTDNPIEECSALMGDEELRSAIRDMFERAELTAALPREDSRVVVGALMALLTYCNWQHPGVCHFRHHTINKFH